MASVVTDTFSDIDMHCPPDWENGYKPARVIKFGDGDRQASNLWSGEWRSSEFEIEFDDASGYFRRAFASPTERYFTRPWTVKMTTRENRAVKGDPYVVFHGPPVNAQPLPGRRFKFMLGDIISQGMLADDGERGQLPWRKIRDCGLLEKDSPNYSFVVSEKLDLDHPETILYGVHLRVPGIDPPSPQGFEWAPIYLGIETIAGTDYHEWMICGHAVADITDVIVVEGENETRTSVLADAQWKIPHQAAFTTMFGAVYRDIRSHTFGVDRRYTTILAEVGNADADACAAGDKALVCHVEGVEPNGDGTGAVIKDRFDQRDHFMVNFIAHTGADSYQSGAWLTNPTSDVFGVPVPVIDEDSYTVAKAIALLRVPAVEGNEFEGGYIGAAVVGANPSDRRSRRAWWAEWNRSCGCQGGFTHLGQERIALIHPTAAIKAAAPLYTDAYHIIDGSFGTDMLWGDQANVVPFKADMEHRTGQWRTSDVAKALQSIVDYERDINGQEREYRFAPGITMAYHLALMEALVMQHPPRMIRFEVTVGPDRQDDSLGYRDLFDYIRYRDYDAVSNADNEERLGMVLRHQVQAGGRKVLVDVLDLEDLMDFDAPPSVPPSQANTACADAIVVTPEDPIPTRYRIDIDTTDFPTDSSVTLSQGPGVAYHACWHKFTPLLDGTLNISAILSEYDTQLAVFTGVCGTLTEIAYNDNVLGLQTSSIGPIDVTNGTDYYILACGYGPNDGGLLKLDISFDSPSLP